ncbi:iron-sulfur cluster repair di-iron protein [Fodinibius sediminis]|uniref:Regulator of cell morphogenesis and NO signaling n=1 Tax=Fodinibius sediminis TaxID=1214077 RepID=A0A521BLB2_9BACT|nr:iron-sulfur cluster repair di-iron protein [Fodinibius sediminis]SMO47948.1 regulator of cell morphogenesis and NO signaling [Fodinibius sediminis]
METLQTQTVGQIVANDYRAAQVFRNFGLDFCCGGNKTIEEAAVDKNIDPLDVKKALQGLKKNGVEQHNYNQWSLDFLIDYIVNNHHKFTRNKLPEIAAYAHKVAKVHGQRHPELLQINQEFSIMHSEILNHLEKEERILFPYINKLLEAKEKGTKADIDNFGMAADPISMMEEEHDEAGASMAKIRRLSNNFTPPEDACATYRVLFENLAGFEKDLHKHVHLENNILFPKALELERTLH